MSKALSLKLRDDVFADTEAMISMLDMPRNTYINEAVAFYNRLLKKKRLRNTLEKESRLVAENTLSVLSELEELEDEILE